MKDSIFATEVSNLLNSIKCRIEKRLNTNLHNLEHPDPADLVLDDVEVANNVATANMFFIGLAGRMFIALHQGPQGRCGLHHHLPRHVCVQLHGRCVRRDPRVPDLLRLLP